MGARGISIVTTLGLCAACEGTITRTGPEAFADGTRLVAYGFASPDDPTVRLLRTWHDRDLGFDCRFVSTGDGYRRCLPDEEVSRFYTSPDCSDQPFYADVHPRECSPRLARYAVGTTGHCEVSYRVVELAQTPTSATMRSFRFYDSEACRSTDELPPSSHAYCSTTEAALHQFVSAPEAGYGDASGWLLVRADDGSMQIDGRPSCAPRQPTPEVEHHGTGRLRSIWYRASEQARVPEQHALHDAQFGFDCYPRERDDGSVICWPTDAATSLWSVYTDPDCTARVGHMLGDVAEMSPLPTTAAGASRVYVVAPRQRPAGDLYFDDRVPGEPHHFFRCQPLLDPLAIVDLTPIVLASLDRFP